MAIGWCEAWELWLTTSRGTTQRPKGNALPGAQRLLESLPPDLRGEAQALFGQAALAWTQGRIDVACDRAMTAVNERVQDFRYMSLCGLFLALSGERPEDGATWLEASVVALGSLPAAERPRERLALQRALVLAYADSRQLRRAVNLLRMVPLADVESAIAPYDQHLRARVLGVGEPPLARAEVSSGSMAALRSSASDVARIQRMEAARAQVSSASRAVPNREAALARALHEAVAPAKAFLEPVRGSVRAWSKGRSARGVLLLASILAVYAGLRVGLRGAAVVLAYSHTGLVARTFGPQLAMLLVLWLPGFLGAGALRVGEWLVWPHRPRYTVRSLWLGPLVYATLILLCVVTWHASRELTGLDSVTFGVQPIGVATSLLVDALLLLGVVGLWTGGLERLGVPAESAEDSIFSRVRDAGVSSS